MDTPRKIDYSALKGWIDSKKEAADGTPKSVGIVNEADLIKVGGLYRIRDNYEPVWKMESSEDGKRYIVRADEGGETAPERLLVTSESIATDSAKAAYKIVEAGSVYVAWECEACATPNLTKFGNLYECDECHKRYADVLKTEDQQRQDKATYTRAEVAEHSPEFAKRMATLGIRVAHKSLLQAWDREATTKTAGFFEDYGDEMGEQQQVQCPMCGGPGMELGSLGRQQHFRCRNCGAQFSLEAPRAAAKTCSNCHQPIKDGKCQCSWRGTEHGPNAGKGPVEGAKAVNPWAVCHESVGPEKSEKFERCVKDVKKKSPIKQD